MFHWLRKLSQLFRPNETLTPAKSHQTREMENSLPNYFKKGGERAVVSQLLTSVNKSFCCHHLSSFFRLSSIFLLFFKFVFIKWRGILLI